MRRRIAALPLGLVFACFAVLAAELRPAPVDLSGSAPRFGSPQRLLESPLAVTMEWRCDVTRDGERFLFVLPVQEARAEPFTLVAGWRGASIAGRKVGDPLARGVRKHDP
jgi:hypothetical protein